MCTTIAENIDGGLIFGRNMDIDGGFDEKIVITPRNYKITYKRHRTSTDHYAIIGTAAVMDSYPLYADGMNEKGLCMAGLNFVGNAYYNGYYSNDTDIAPYELISLILSECADIREAVGLLKCVNLINVPFKDTIPLPRLHFHIADKERSIVYESTRDGRHIYENDSGVLANSPAFPHHIANLKQYKNLKNHTLPDTFSDETPYSLGMGAIGMPGDYTSMSRFVRASFIKEHSEGEQSISHMMHMLDTVAVPRGAVLTTSGSCHYTRYQCCMSTRELTYSIRTYDSIAVSNFSLSDADLDAYELIEADIK